MVDDITSVIEVAAPREQVWRALTEPDAVMRWMRCLNFTPVVGSLFHLQPDRARRDAGDITDAIVCRVEVLDRPRRLGFSWGFPRTPDTWVDFRLRRIPGGVLVRLTHSGWDRFEGVKADAVRGGLGRAWHTVALPALRDVAGSLT